MNGENELPEGWDLVKLPAISQINMGQSPPGTTYNKNGLGLPFFQGKIDFTDYYPKIRVFCTEPKKIANPGDILLCVRAPVGPTNIANCTCAIGRGLAALAPLGGIPTEFILNYLRLMESELESYGTGSTFTAITKKTLEEFDIPLPPLAEQRRIIAAVEALLDRVNASRERLDRVPGLLKAFRQAVLAAACSGRLTEGWREKNSYIENVDDIFNAIQELRDEKYFNDVIIAKKNGKQKPKDQRKNKRSNKKIIDLPNLPDNWRYYRLEDISYQVTDGTHVTPNYQDDGIPFLSVKNIRPFLLRDVDIKKISQEEHKKLILRCNPEFDDILYTKVGATYGFAALNHLNYPFSIFVSLALIKPVKELFLPKYAEIVMNSELVFAQARDRVSGIGTPDLHLIEIRDFRIPFPPISEQHEIVRRVESLFALADNIDQRVAAGKERADRLTQAILAKAFRGELVPTEAELARKEERDYEPASVLLERIREEIPKKGKQK